MGDDDNDNNNGNATGKGAMGYDDEVSNGDG
jgi:hypothetical protein